MTEMNYPNLKYAASLYPSNLERLAEERDASDAVRSGEAAMGEKKLRGSDPRKVSGPDARVGVGRPAPVRSPESATQSSPGGRDTGEAVDNEEKELAAHLRRLSPDQLLDLRNPKLDALSLSADTLSTLLAIVVRVLARLLGIKVNQPFTTLDGQQRRYLAGMAEAELQRRRIEPSEVRERLTELDLQRSALEFRRLHLIARTAEYQRASPHAQAVAAAERVYDIQMGQSGGPTIASLRAECDIAIANEEDLGRDLLNLQTAPKPPGIVGLFRPEGSRATKTQMAQLEIRLQEARDHRERAALVLEQYLDEFQSRFEAEILREEGRLAQERRWTDEEIQQITRELADLAAQREAIQRGARPSAEADTGSDDDLSSRPQQR